MITRRLAKLATAIAFAFALALSFAPAANAEEPIPSPGIVQIPITAVTPIQVCNNNVAAGLIAVAVDALNDDGCIVP
jgi:hypothetical protein